MSFRRSAAVALAAAALVSGCKKVTKEPPVQEIVIAAFNSPVLPGSSTPALPTPNDLALQAAAAMPASAQRSLLAAFVNAGGFPSDQAVGITVPLKRIVFDEATSRYVVATPPLVDPATLTTGGAAATVVVMKVDVSPPELVNVEPDIENCTAGQIAIRKAKGPSGSRAWAPGRYAFAIRGGMRGVKTTTGQTVSPDQAIALVVPNRDLSNPENRPIGFPPELAGPVDSVRRALWLPLDWGDAGGVWTAAPSGSIVPAFIAVSSIIRAEEVVSIATFEVAPAIPTAPVDSASGIAPLPIDLLRTGPGGTIALNAAFGPAAQGLTTLDGFSTTAMMFAPVTVPVDASTVDGSTVHLFKLSGGTATLLKELRQEFARVGSGGDPSGAAYVAEPTPITTSQGMLVAPGVPCAAAGGCSLLVALQPAVGVAVPAPLRGPLGKDEIHLPPLDEFADYAVVITTSVKDMLGRPLRKSTVAKILTDPGFDPVATSSVDGTSLLAGIPDATATALRRMREQLVPVLSELQAATGKTAADVALAYTFRTQGRMTSTALALVKAPYDGPVAVGVSSDPDAVTTFTPAQVAAAYGVSETVLTAPGSIAELAEVKFHSVSWLLASRNEGAFDPANATTETITALVTIPDPSLVAGTCPTSFDTVTYTPVAYTASKCAPLVVFEHGLTSSKAAVLPLAAALAARGFVVAAIDLPMHGERSYCSGSGPNAQALADAMCCPAALCGEKSVCAFKSNLRTPGVDLDAGGEIQVGMCELESAPGVRGRMLDHRFDSDTTPSPKGTAFASANRLISLNFFRVRDALRQDVIDVSALVKALAPVGKSSDAFAAHLESTHGIAVDFSKVYWVGHSGGVFAGTASLAANPRITRAVAYAGGATAIDVFANPESHFNAALVDLLGGAGIAPGTPDYLKFLQIGKWILDPADPANFARYVVPGGLFTAFAVPPLDPDLVALWPSQPAREVLTQLSICDGTVPNAQNTLLSALLGLPVPAPPTTTTGRVQWFSQTGAGTCPGDQVSHSNIIDFATPSLTQQAQTAIGSFLATPANVATPVTP